MYTLKQTLHDQKNLKELCAPRALKSSEIHFAPNAFYGNSSIIKDYVGLPQNYPLPVVVPHGATYSSTYVWEEEITSRPKVVWAWTERRAAIHHAKSKKIQELNAMPFVYLMHMLGKPKTKKQGTVFFLADHSTEHIHGHTNYEAIITRLNKLPAKYQPVTVSLYFVDYNRLGKLFQDAGFKVVSPGHYYDPNYLYRFYHLYSQYKYATANSILSGIIYLTELGCPFFFLSDNIITKFTHDHLARMPSQLVIDTHKKRLGTVYGESYDKPTELQIRTANHYLGKKYFKSPEQLRQDLHNAEKLLK